MTEAELGWAAGIIDVEGCITITKQEPGKSGRVNTSHRMYLKVTMGHRPTVDRLRMIFDGVGAICEQRSTRGHNPAWSWFVASREAERVLKTLRPMLFTKSDEADVALEFMAFPRWLTGGAGGNQRLPPELVASREDCFIRLRDLKPSARFRAAKAAA